MTVRVQNKEPVLVAEPLINFKTKRINRECFCETTALWTALLCRATFVSMVKPTDLRNVDYSSQCRCVDGARFRRILF